MYTDFYNLKEKPFNLTPSPRYLYLGDIHKEALALLTYGVVERKGFILLTGEVGTGKTTMVQALLSRLDQNVQHSVYLSNPLLSTSEFMDYLAFSAFKRKVHFKSKAEFLIEFERFLKSCLQQQENFILLIDEAHKLSFELLEEVRLLSNLETAEEKLVNIFLVGQPELNKKLSQPQCRALLQRISVRYDIKPLSLKETHEYIVNRLKIAGAKEQKIFPGAAIKSIYRYSGGFPRMINILCDNALLLAYAREKRSITPAMIEECQQDLKLEVPAPRKQKENRDKESREEEIPQSSWKRYANLSILLILAFVVGMFLTGKGLEIYHRIFSTETTSQAAVSHDRTPSPQKKTEMAKLNKNTQEFPADVDKKDEPVVFKGKYSVSTIDRKSSAEVKQRVVETSGPVTALVSEKIRPSRTVVIQEGDTVAGLASDIYGMVNSDILEQIKENNPDLKDINWITVGQKIVFPALKPSPKAAAYSVHIASIVPVNKALGLYSELIENGYEAYILPFNDPEKGNSYRITVGKFSDVSQAEAFALKLVEKGVSDHAKPIRIEAK